MIELVIASRCIDCDRCVKVCPTNVFDPVPGGHPVIARQRDCQTCFMCEAYCPVDALYVAPFRGPVADLASSPGSPEPPGSPSPADRPPAAAAVAVPVAEVDETRLAAAGRFGEYRRWIGWGRGRRPGTLRDANAVLPELAAAYLGDDPMR
jgi:NAD-dependent dihydropyrimidine dehydrogenase PreA subunit